MAIIGGVVGGVLAVAVVVIMALILRQWKKKFNILGMLHICIAEVMLRLAYQ